jgi:glycosyltransferase involved in cell wall biosynthesis
MIRDFLNTFTVLTTVQWIVFVAFLVVFVIRFMYLFLFTARIIFEKESKPATESKESLSIIMTLRNEEENIRENLPAILQLEKIDYEVVVIDDFSQDTSLSVLGLLNQRYGRLKISTLSQETRYSVKLAQNIALKSASNNWVLVSPITLNEVSEKWLCSFVERLDTNNTNLIIGYSTIVANKKLFNLLYRIENFYQQIKSAGYISNNIPFVYSEENLAFKKEKYFELGGYDKNIQEPYANLELIVNKFIRKKNSVLNINNVSAIRKQIDVNKPEYFDLLKKSFRIEHYLPLWKKQLLFIDTLTQLLLIPLLVAIILCCFPLWPLITMLIGLKLIAHVLIIKIILNRLNERKIFIPSLVYALVMPYYNLFFRLHFNRNSRKQKWRSMV